MLEWKNTDAYIATGDCEHVYTIYRDDCGLWHCLVNGYMTVGPFLDKSAAQKWAVKDDQESQKGRE